MELEKIIKKMAYEKAFFYVTLDPERALGLEDVLPNYTILCPYKSKLTDELKRKKDSSVSSVRGAGVAVLVLEEHLASTELEKIVERGTYGILQSDFVRNHINRTCMLTHDRKLTYKNDVDVGVHRDMDRDVYVMVLKNSELIETFCKKQGWNLLAPKANIAEKFENKISQYTLLENAVPYPNSFIAILSDLKWQKTPISSHAFPSKNGFVLQFNRGHSGRSTFFIKSRKDLDKLYALYPKRECKISQYIRGKTYTLNCIVLKNGEVISGSLSEQITGLKAATNNPNTTCGNDFTSPKKLERAQIASIEVIAQKVGKVLHKNEYRGLFGIDVIMEEIHPLRRGELKRASRVYFIELNTHQPASISFEARLHRKIGKMPLLAYFILDSIGAYTPSLEREVRGGFKPPILLPFPAKQIIYRNKTSRVLTKEFIETKYKGKGLLARVKFIKPNEEIYRRQSS